MHPTAFEGARDAASTTSYHLLLAAAGLGLLGASLAVRLRQLAHCPIPAAGPP